MGNDPLPEANTIFYDAKWKVTLNLNQRSGQSPNTQDMSVLVICMY